MKNKVIGFVFLITVFAMMCVLRWWFTIYVIFAFAAAMTVVLKKRKYCHNVCPIAFVQGVTYTKNSKTHDLNEKTRKRMKWVIMSAFWIVLGGLTIYYLAKGNYLLLWHRLLLLMVSSLATAVLLQEIYGKRIWCRYFCPFGEVLDSWVKRIR